MNITKKTKPVLIVASSNNTGIKLIKQWLVNLNKKIVYLKTD